jgi:hypothetical protein
MIITSLNSKEISTLDLKDRWVMMKSILELIMEVRHLFHKEEKLTSKIWWGNIQGLHKWDYQTFSMSIPLDPNLPNLELEAPPLPLEPQIIICKFFSLPLNLKTNSARHNIQIIAQLLSKTTVATIFTPLRHSSSFKRSILMRFANLRKISLYSCHHIIWCKSMAIRSQLQGALHRWTEGMKNLSLPPVAGHKLP